MIKKDYNKLVKRINRLKYEDSSKVVVKLTTEVRDICGTNITMHSVVGFKFYLTDVGLKFEKKIDKIAKECGFYYWSQNSDNSLSFL